MVSIFRNPSNVGAILGGRCERGVAQQETRDNCMDDSGRMTSDPSLPGELDAVERGEKGNKQGDQRSLELHRNANTRQVLG